jgi:hypothetical protein
LTRIQRRHAGYREEVCRTFFPWENDGTLEPGQWDAIQALAAFLTEPRSCPLVFTESTLPDDLPRPDQVAAHYQETRTNFRLGVPNLDIPLNVSYLASYPPSQSRDGYR